jgi:hypothetical protein
MKFNTAVIPGVDLGLLGERPCGLMRTPRSSHSALRLSWEKTAVIKINTAVIDGDNRSDLGRTLQS